jgi:translation initiation factor 5
LFQSIYSNHQTNILFPHSTSQKKDKKDKKKSKSKDEDDSYASDNDSQNPTTTTEDLNDENALQLAIEALKKYLSENPSATPTSIAEKVVNEQMASGLKSQDRIHIYVRAAFDLDCIKTKQIHKNAPTVAKITQGKSVMERHLISAFEGLCVEEPKKFAVVLKQLFDEEVLEEDTILEWAGEGRTDYTLECVDEDQRAALRGEAEPVVCWLQEDDSSDEDEESD